MSQETLKIVVWQVRSNNVVYVQKDYYLPSWFRYVVGRYDLVLSSVVPIICFAEFQRQKYPTLSVWRKIIFPRSVLFGSTSHIDSSTNKHKFKFYLNLQTSP